MEENITNKSALSIAERIKKLIFGSIRFRFNVLLISSGVFLVGGSSIREIVVLAIAELFGAKETVQSWEQADLVAQITGILMILTSVYFFIYFIKEDIRTSKNSVTNSIINGWSKEVPLDSNQTEWLQNNPKWAETFWEITKRTDLSKQERLKMLKTIKTKER